jgi:pseudaminic acid synthase
MVFSIKGTIKMIKIVAEIGASHAGSIDNAKELITQAAYAGADAVKIQLWDRRTMAYPNYLIESGPWSGRSLSSLYEETAIDPNWLPALFHLAKQMKIQLFSSVFDKQSVDVLEEHDCPIYKIASFEIVDLELIRYAASTKKPLIISTGMASRNEVMAALRSSTRSTQVTLLKCTSAYPATLEGCNLNTLDSLKDFGESWVQIGLSDHTQSFHAALVAVGIGVSMIEKHIRLKDVKGLDDGFALLPHEFEAYVDEIREAEKTVGVVKRGPTDEEMPSYALRRSLYSGVALKPGDKITRDNVITMRPALGINPIFLQSIVGRVVNCDIPYGMPLSMDMFK